MWNNLQKKHKQRLRDFISGLTAGIISVTACNPLDITRTRLNLMSSSNHSQRYQGFRHALNTIWRQEGLKGLFSGYRVNVKAIPIFHSMFFPIYENVKGYCREHRFSNWQEYLTSSIVAGGFCNIITNPIWVIRTRVMAQALHHQQKHYHTDKIFKIMGKMVQQQGVSSLFKGISASVLGVSNAVIYFFIYESFKQQLASKDKKTFNSFHVLAASIISKSIASTVTYPFIVARTIMQDHRSAGDGELIRMTEVFRDIYQKKGTEGFYAGLKPDLLRLVPSNAIVFLVYEFMKRHIQINISSDE